VARARAEAAIRESMARAYNGALIFLDFWTSDAYMAPDRFFDRIFSRPFCGMIRATINETGRAAPYLNHSFDIFSRC
jgi:hypothetical protein